MIEVIVTRKEREADGIVSFELRRADGAPLPPFSAGSHVDVHVGRGIIRQYSLWNPSRETDRYRIGILREEHSRGGSVAMHDRVQVGDKLTISEPRNHFPLSREARRSILFAGGIGVTPILCMADRLSHIGADFEMHYCARTQGRMAFVELLKDAPYAGQVHFHLDDGPPDQKLVAESVLGAQTQGTHIYVCGPGGFMSYILDTAKRLGWPSEQVHREYFAAAPVASPTVDGSFEVQIASTGKCITIPAGEPVTRVLQAHGIEIPVSCESGVCGTCITRVLEGTPDHRDSILSDEERAENNQFTPCCSRSMTPCLVLDL